MSAEALAIYSTHQKEQIENGVFTEEAVLDGAEIIKGVFDDSLMIGSADAANQPRQSSRIRFLVDTVPTFTPRTTTLEIRGKSYIIQKADQDANGIRTLWLA